MIHQSSSNTTNPKIIQREFVSDFEVGECWGYNRFFRLDLLASEGYLNIERDTLELRFQVRPSTFYERCRDQQWYIGQLLKKQEYQANEIRQLKDRLRRETARNRHNNDNNHGGNITEITTSAVASTSSTLAIANGPDENTENRSNVINLFALNGNSEQQQVSINFDGTESQAHATNGGEDRSKDTLELISDLMDSLQGNDENNGPSGSEGAQNGSQQLTALSM